MLILQTIVIVILLSVIKADPNCTTHGEGSVVCTPGDTDYVLKRGLVSDNNMTTSITLRWCRLTGVDKGAFKDLFSLKYLDLSRNSISNITLDVFAGSLPELIHLNISYNELTVIHLPIFDSLVNLQVLDLRGNKIKAIEVGASVITEKLLYLDISDNDLQSNIVVKILSINSNARYLDVSKNDISMVAAKPECLFLYTHLEVLHLDRCDMIQVPNLKCSNLRTIKHLTLTGNKVNRIPADSFDALTSLEILDLSYNPVDTIEDNVFKNNGKLKTIILRNNKLKAISVDVFRALPRLASLDLSYNLLEDVTVNAFLGSPLRYLNLAGNKFTYLQNNFCLELRNSRTSLRKFNFNHNPWQCACLNDVLAEVKKYNIDYNTDNYNGNEPVCAVEDRFKCERQQSENERFSVIYNRAIEQYHLMNPRQ